MRTASLFLASLLLFACSDDSTSGGSSAAGGSSASGGSSAGGSAAGGSSAGGSSAGGSSSGGSSAGGSSAGGSSGTDTRAQALTFARDDLACQTDDDCCVVYDLCQAQGLIVAKADQAEVEQLLSQAANEACLKCIPPTIEVSCNQGLCVGTKVDPITVGAKNHCGKLAPSNMQQAIGDIGKAAQVIGCGG